MNQRDGFTGGFIAGTIVGGIVGGAIGALVASYQRASELEVDAEPRRNANPQEANNSRRKRRQFKAANSDQSIELARRSLEDKIAQLNETIDEVRLTLGEVNGDRPPENPDRPISRES